MKTLTSSCRPSRTSSTHLLPLALYHVIWRQRSSNLCWKKHHLTKIFWRNGNPISNLPFLSKILEEVVLHKLLSRLQENNLRNPLQSAYRAGHSTETILLCIVKDILSALDNNISVSSKFSSPAWTLFWAFSLLHSNSFSHTSQTEISPLQSITHLRHHHSSCTVCLRAQYWGPFSSSCTLRLSPI